MSLSQSHRHKRKLMECYPHSLKGKKKKIIFENITWLMFKRRHPYKLELIHWEEKLNRQILMVYFVHFMDNRVKNV